MGQWDGPSTGQGGHSGYSYPSEIGLRKKRRTRIWIGILVGVLAGNVLAASTYLAMNGFGREAPPSTPAGIGAPADDAGAVARAHRTAGLEALERNDYDRAIEAFMSALKAPSPPPDVPQLLTIARDLRAEAEREAESASQEPAPARRDDGPPREERRGPTTSTPPARPVRDVKAPARPTRAPDERPTPKRRDEPASSPSKATATPATGPGSDSASDPDELPLCPEDWTPPPANTPYAVLPRKCRPR